METFIHGCPVCRGDIKGEEKCKYYCKKCNLLFDKKFIVHPKTEHKVQPPAQPKAESITLKLVVSSQSNRYHRPDCRYVRQIERKNLKGFASKTEAEKAGYFPCVCVRNK